MNVTAMSPLEALADLRDMRRRLDEHIERNRIQMALALRQGADMGIPVTRLAEVAGVTRRTVYRLMDDAPALGQEPGAGRT